jgi:hypothetical protein
MIGVVLYMGAVALTTATPARDPSTFAHANTIRIEGVCVELREDARYSVYASVDFWRIDITRGDSVGHVYIGWNPELTGPDREWDQRLVEKSLRLPVVAPLSGDQAGQYLGIPKGHDDAYFHLWFDKKDSQANKEILSLLGFC